MSHYHLFATPATAGCSMRLSGFLLALVLLCVFSILLFGDFLSMEAHQPSRRAVGKAARKAADRPLLRDGLVKGETGVVSSEQDVALYNEDAQLSSLRTSPKQGEKVASSLRDGLVTGETEANSSEQDVDPYQEEGQLSSLRISHKQSEKVATSLQDGLVTGETEANSSERDVYFSYWSVLQTKLELI